ncbi:MAG: hypothetical protein AB1Z98_36155, partial [Nannocystaceae bacterium]
SPEKLEATLEQVMRKSLYEIEANYRTHARKAYEGYGYEQTVRLPVEWIDEDEEIDGPEAYTLSVGVDLDCAAEDTLGPLPDERRGMYQVRRMTIPDNAGAVLRVQGDPNTWVQVFDPYARRHRGQMIDWMLPSKFIDRNAIELRPGDVLDLELRPGVWAVVLGSDDVDAGSVRLDVELTAPPPPPDPTEWR